MTETPLPPAVVSLLSALADGVVVVRDATILFVNPAAAKMFGYEESALLGQDLEMLVPEPERETHAHVRGRYQAAPRARLMGARSGLLGRRQDGSYFRVDVSLSPIDVDEEAAVLALVRDMSGREPGAAEDADGDDE